VPHGPEDEPIRKPFTSREAAILENPPNGKKVEKERKLSYEDLATAGTPAQASCTRLVMGEFSSLRKGGQ